MLDVPSTFVAYTPVCAEGIFVVRRRLNDVNFTYRIYEWLASFRPSKI